MQIHIHHHHHIDADSEVLRRFDALEDKLDLIIQNQETIMAAIDDLETSVAAEDTVIDGAVTLLNGIPALIAAAGTDPARLTALQNDIKDRTAKLAAAIVVGTPAPSANAPAVTAAAATQAATAAATS